MVRTHPKIKETMELYNLVNNSRLQLRNDGRVEWVCEHGIGHTINVPKKHEESDAWWTHGCDGCCKKIFEIKNIREEGGNYCKFLLRH